MSDAEKKLLRDQIVDKARSLGASLAGIASVQDLKKSPSHEIYPKIGPNKGVGSRECIEGIKPGEIAWPQDAKSVLIIALAHPEVEPELDWWVEGEEDRESKGARILQAILKDLAKWIETECDIRTHMIPYHVEKGGIFFKDPAILAGLGCIGKNNLLLTPEYGPRVRVWPLFLDKELPSSGPLVFDPCRSCDEPCRKVCPQNAFERIAHSPKNLAMDDLPGRDGSYDRDICRPETEKNVQDKEFILVPGHTEPAWTIKFCRLCELACPVGKA